MRKRTPLPEGDDGRRIADMSGVEAPSLFGHLPWREKTPPAAPQEPDANALAPEERRIYMWAAIKAALFTAAFYIVGFGVLIRALIWLWSLGH